MILECVETQAMVCTLSRCGTALQTGIWGWRLIEWCCGDSALHDSLECYIFAIKPSVGGSLSIIIRHISMEHSPKSIPYLLRVHATGRNLEHLVREMNFCTCVATT
jgi:hypothetical protein